MPYDPWDQYANTATINRGIETWLEKKPLIGPQIAPLVSVQDRKLKKQQFEIEAFGKGQFKARNATPAIYTPQVRWNREMIELVLLEEMTEIEEDEWHDLTSPDEGVRRRVGTDIVTRTRVLQMRNERLTEDMRFRAFRDQLEIVFPNDAQKYQVLYGIPATNQPVATIQWTDRVNSTPITNIRTWQKMMSRVAGAYGTKVHMNSDTYEELEFSKEVYDKIVGVYNPNPHTPTQTEIESRLYQGSTIIISDAGIRPDGKADDRGLTAHDLYIPNGKVLITTDYTDAGDGEGRIADVADGRVAVTTQGGPPLVWKQGMQTETMYDLHAKTHFIRQASARIPRIHSPKAFVWATVFTP